MRSSDFVIVKINGSQEKVQEGMEISVNKLDGEEKGKLEFSEVLLTSKAGKIQVGKPTVKGALVHGIIVEQAKGEKVTTRIYKAKSRYRRVKGMRPQITKIKITKI